ncbi:hypothetical protein NAC44_18560 [Allorhizobium sp. BGMRC 0089]|uniref:hypothetical protein n=1 Tax=Allorhizobium sonneratiae TaxID=2934936 RepID=UPI0020343D31|nr:hypothetical protein [Allorhizobium sonneratiae]MCM2294331.1 hypothetical protein [Allorhizobium sonneratiae]
MRKFLCATVLAVSTLALGAAAAQAETVVIKKKEHHHERHCFNKKVVRWHHGKKIVHMERVCR